MDELKQLIDEGKSLTNFIVRGNDPTFACDFDHIEESKFTPWLTKCIFLLERNYSDSSNTIRFKQIAEQTYDGYVDKYEKLMLILTAIWQCEIEYIK